MTNERNDDQLSMDRTPAEAMRRALREAEAADCEAAIAMVTGEEGEVTLSTAGYESVLDICAALVRMQDLLIAHALGREPEGCEDEDDDEAGEEWKTCEA